MQTALDTILFLRIEQYDEPHMAYRSSMYGIDTSHKHDDRGFLRPCCLCNNTQLASADLWQEPESRLTSSGSALAVRKCSTWIDVESALRLVVFLSTACRVFIVFLHLLKFPYLGPYALQAAIITSILMPSQPHILGIVPCNGPYRSRHG